MGVSFFCTLLLAVPVAFCYSSCSSFAAAMAMMPPNNATPHRPNLASYPQKKGADNPWQAVEEATQEPLPDKCVISKTLEDKMKQ